MKPRSWLYFVTILVSIVWSTQLIAQDQPDKNLNKIMTKIGGIMVELFPLTFTDKTLTNFQIRKVNRLAKELQTLFRSAGPHIRRKSPTYQLSYQLLSDYLNAIVNEDNPISIAQVKSRLRSLSDFCISCHTQDDKFRTLFAGTSTISFDSALANAEFNYATRNYKTSHEYYKKHLLLSSKLSEAEILRTLFRIISIYTQILNQPDQAIKALEELEKQMRFSTQVASYIQEAKKALTYLQKIITDDKLPKTFLELEDHANQYLGGINARQGIIFATPQEEVERMWLRGLLFRYLNENPSRDQIPYILYWLALCDRSLGHGYDYTLADIYIKQCITLFPKHPVARLCFNEHKEYLKFFYTTPTEPVLPFEVNEELEKLERYLGSN